MISKLRAWKPPNLARRGYFEKCAFFMLALRAWLGLYGGGKRTLKSYNDALGHAPSSPKI